MIKIILSILFVLFIPTKSSSTVSAAECKECHLNQFYLYQKSIHANYVECIDCHKMIHNDQNISSPIYPTVKCNNCHYIQNKHGVGSLKERPQCVDCHNKHLILSHRDAESSVNRQNFRFTCSRCHQDQFQETNYLMFLPSFIIRSHKKQEISKNYSRSDCIGCHQGKAVHGNDSLLSQNRCDICHKPLGKSSIYLGSFHKKFNIKNQPFESVAAILYQLILLFSIFISLTVVVIKKGSKGNNSC